VGRGKGGTRAEGSHTHGGGAGMGIGGGHSTVASAVGGRALGVGSNYTGLTLVSHHLGFFQPPPLAGPLAGPQQVDFFFPQSHYLCYSGAHRFFLEVRDISSEQNHRNLLGSLGHYWPG
jgi:hypothetical protein